MAIGRVVPWSCWREWIQVYADLFSESGGRRQQALTQLSAWRSRGKIPLGVDITALLVEAQLRDGGRGTGPPSAGAASDEVLRLQYSMAVVRLVNGISDSSQKGRVAASVAGHAAQAGLPRVLVDVRHEASHNELPALPLLRLAARQALAWLRAAYWQRQSDHLQHQHARIVALLQALVDLQLGSDGATTAAERSQQSAAALGQLKDVPVLPPLAHLLVEPLLDSGVMDPLLAVDSQHGTALAVLGPLFQHWVQLPALLLHGAVQRLALPAEDVPPLQSGDHTTPEACQRLISWAELLLQPGQRPTGTLPSITGRGKKRKSTSSADSAPAQSTPCTISAAQIRALLKQLQTTLEKASPRRAGYLIQASQLLVDHLRDNHPHEHARWGSAMEVLLQFSSPEAPSSTARAAPAASGAQTSSEVSEQHAPAATDSSGSRLGVWAASSQPAPASGRPGSALPGTQTACAGEAREAAVDPAVLAAAAAAQEALLQRGRRSNSPAQATPRKRRWTRVPDWQSCAIGHLPCPHNPNGSLPCLAQPDKASPPVAANTSGLQMQPGTAHGAPQGALTAADAIKPTSPAEAAPTEALVVQDSLYPDAFSAFNVVDKAEPTKLEAVPLLIEGSRIGIL